MIFSIIIILIMIVIAATCDFTYVTLNDSDIKLLYSDEENLSSDIADDPNKVFLNNSVEDSMKDATIDSRKEQAEALLDRIYNG